MFVEIILSTLDWFEVTNTENFSCILTENQNRNVYQTIVSFYRIQFLDFLWDPSRTVSVK